MEADLAFMIESYEKVPGMLGQELSQKLISAFKARIESAKQLTFTFEAGPRSVDYWNDNLYVPRGHCVFRVEAPGKAPRRIVVDSNQISEVGTKPKKR